MKHAKAVEEFDVLIVGAGISGIGMAVHLQQKCPGRSFVMLERRDVIGGTWNLFHYPGIRSDSDMHTLGFEFEPWREQKAIADGPNILKYLQRIKRDHGLDQHIRTGHKVVSAKWSSETARWLIEAETPDGLTRINARFLYMGSGYYDYDEPHKPVFQGREDFAGDILHPQFWPKDYDYSGKKVVVIGSGATAVTLVPAMTDKASHVTMLQRTPTWYANRPARDWLANNLRKILPESWAYAITRFKNIQMQQYFYKKARTNPEAVKKYLLKQVGKALGKSPDPVTFTPPYNPWEQRLCLVPDEDLFVALREGKADIVTDHISHFTEKGIQLKSGEHLDADVIVTATGLKLVMAGKVDFSVDGQPVNFTEHFYYKGCMLSNIPNMAIIFGYLNASWTLKVDIVARYLCNLLNHMQQQNMDIALPHLPDPDALQEEDLFAIFSSGYVQRAADKLPRNADALPWRLTQDYLVERKVLTKDPVDDGVMQFRKADARSISEPADNNSPPPETVAAE